jgi:hypothetical protein
MQSKGVNYLRFVGNSIQDFRLVCMCFDDIRY